MDILMLQWLGGAGFQDLLNQMENLGFFRYVLPFLLIFAVVFAILTKLSTFKDNKGASVLVSVAIGLLALQLDIVPAFFQNIFPKFGVGIAILIVALILGGAFISETDDSKVFKWVFFGLGMLIFLIVVLSSITSWQFSGGYWFSQYLPLIVVLIVIIVAIVLVVKFGSGSSSEGSK